MKGKSRKLTGIRIYDPVLTFKNIKEFACAIAQKENEVFLMYPKIKALAYIALEIILASCGLLGRRVSVVNFDFVQVYCFILFFTIKR
jgi:hypothetical protein